MGESKIEYYSVDETIVFWNSDDYPIPSGADLRSIRGNIDEALDQMGFHGMREIRVYGHHLNHHIDEWWESGIMYFPKTSRVDNSAVFRMPLQMITCSRARGPLNFLVIAKQSPESELHRVQKCVQSRNNTVLVVDDTAQESPFLSVQSLVDCTQFLDGGKPISKEPHTSDSDFDSDAYDEEEDASSQFDISRIKDISKIEDISKIKDISSKMEDFSKRLTPVNGAKTAVFWDVVDCPFPLCSNPDMIYRKIDKALRDRDCRGEMSIWAYVDENNESCWGEFLLREKKTWETRIYFLPGGASRCNRMLNDILLWAMDSPVDLPDPANLIVVSDKFRDDTYFFRMLRNFNDCYYCVFLVTPPEHGNKPESPEWPGLLLDDAYAFGFESESSEPVPKKHKEDAAGETPEEGSGDQG